MPTSSISHIRYLGMLAVVLLLLETRTNATILDARSVVSLEVNCLVIWLRQLLQSSVRGFQQLGDFSDHRRPYNPRPMLMTRQHLLLLRSFFGLLSPHRPAQGAFGLLTTCIDGWSCNIKRGSHRCPYGMPVYLTFEDSDFSESDVSDWHLILLGSLLWHISPFRDRSLS